MTLQHLNCPRLCQHLLERYVRRWHQLLAPPEIPPRDTLVAILSVDVSAIEPADVAAALGQRALPVHAGADHCVVVGRVQAQPLEPRELLGCNEPARAVWVVRVPHGPSLYLEAEAMAAALLAGRPVLPGPV